MSRARSKVSRPLVYKIPGLGALLEMAGDYVSEGAVDYFQRVPPIRLWLRSMGWPVVVSALLALLPFPCGCFPGAFSVSVEPSQVAFALIPSLLGFGIGAYALIFGLTGDILRKIQDAHNARPVAPGEASASVLHINSAFAFPLAVMATTLIFGAVQSVFKDLQWLNTVTWFLTFFCLFLSFQLIAALYRLGRVIILEKF